MLLIFLGPPGSGKGTQAKLISNQLNIKHTSTGDMLRAFVKTGTEFATKVGQYIERGDLVTDEMVNQIVKETLAQEEFRKGCVLDGYPRTITQAEFLESIFSDNYHVIYFKISAEKLAKRIECRFSCVKCGAIYNTDLKPLIQVGVCDNCGSSVFNHRTDDNMSSLKTRLDKFEEQISMILSFYKKREKLSVIDADQELDQVTKQIFLAIKKD